MLFIVSTFAMMYIVYLTVTGNLPVLVQTSIEYRNVQLIFNIIYMIIGIDFGLIIFYFTGFK